LCRIELHVSSIVQGLINVIREEKCDAHCVLLSMTKNLEKEAESTVEPVYLHTHESAHPPNLHS